MSQNTVDITVRSTDQSARGLDQAAKSAGRFKDTLRDVGKTAAGVLTADIAMKAAQGFKNLVTDSISQASDLNESLNAVNVTFGASAKEIVDWGKSNAASFGLSQKAFNEMATPLGAMLKNAGLSMQDTTKWTVDLTKRAADMASVFNTTVPDALEAIQAGLRGESDPLERYGVGLSAAKVEAEALAETGKRAAGSLSDQEKATARLNLIMKQTSSTQGDFANTSDGAANAARIASAQFDNAKASLGNALLPVLGKAATAAAMLAEGFNSLPGATQSAVVIIGALTTAVVLLAPKVIAAKEKLSELGDGALAADTKLGKLARGASVVASGLAVMQAAGAAFGSDVTVGATVASKALEEYARTGKMAGEITSDLDYTMMTLDDNEWYNKATKGIHVLIEQVSGLGGVIDNSIEHSNQAISSLDAGLSALVQGGHADEAAAAFARLRQEADGVPIERLNQAFPQYQEALAQAAKQSDETSGATKNLTLTIEQQREAVSKASSSMLDQRSALRELESSYDDASESIKENGRTLDEGTEKGRSNQAALDDIASAAFKARDAVFAHSGSQSEANAIMKTAEARFIAAATAMGMAAPEAKKLAAELFAIPKETTANVTVNTATANNRLDALRQKLIGLQGLFYDISAGTQGHGAGVYKASGGITGAATGGMRSGRTWVGESGPELIDLPPGTTVHSNPTSRRMETPGMGDTTVNVYVTSPADPYQIGRETAWAVKTS